MAAIFHKTQPGFLVLLVLACIPENSQAVSETANVRTVGITSDGSLLENKKVNARLMRVQAPHAKEEQEVEASMQAPRWRSESARASLTQADVSMEAPRWRSESARESLTQHIRRSIASLRREGRNGIDSFPEIYTKRDQWLRKFSELKNDIPTHIIGSCFSIQRDCLMEQKKGNHDTTMTYKQNAPSYAKYMDLGGLEKRLREGGNVDEPDGWGRTAAHHAVLNADMPMLNMLLAWGAKFDQPDKWATSPRNLLSDPWRMKWNTPWPAMAARLGIHAKKEDKHALNSGGSGLQPTGWTEATRLPWPRLMHGVGELDIIAPDTQLAEIHEQYFAKEKPFKTNVFQSCPSFLKTFAKDALSQSDLMWTVVHPGRVPYGENGRPMNKETTMADFMAQHMGRKSLSSNISYKNVPPYVFEGIEVYTRQRKPHNHTRATGHREEGKIRAKWYKMWRSLHKCMAKSIGWYKDLRIGNPKSWTVGLGSGGSGAPHHAHAAAVNLAVVGRKLWHVYPPAVGNYTSDPVSLWQNRREAGSVMPPVSFVQEAGDMVFIPASWAHATMCLGDSISFSAVLPNSMTGRDLEPGAITCALGGAPGERYCKVIDPSTPGVLSMIDVEQMPDPSHPFDPSRLRDGPDEMADEAPVDEPPMTRPKKKGASRSLQRRQRHVLSLRK